MSAPHWSQTMLPRERIEQLENVNAQLRQQLEQAEARVAELESQQQLTKGTLLCPKWAKAQVLRKQAEAVEACYHRLGMANTAKGCRSHLSKEYQRLRQQADELENNHA